MKLLDLILDDANLDEACNQVKKAKGVNGVDKMSYQDGLKRIEKNSKKQLEAEHTNHCLFEE